MRVDVAGQPRTVEEREWGQNKGSDVSINQTEQEDAREKFYRHLFGGQHGLLALFSGVRMPDGDVKKTSTRYFDYPASIGGALAHATKESDAGREVWHCAHLLTGKRRTKKNAAPVVTLWGDLDGAEIPNGTLLPTGIVGSSPGRFHCYWRLSEEIPPELAEELNKRLAAVVGADPSGFDLTQLLRVPGTINYKYPDRIVVTILGIDGSRSYTPREMDEALPKIEKSQEPRSRDASGEPPVVLAESALRVWRGEDPKLRENGDPDRSSTLVKIGRVLYDAGATRPVIVTALAERDEALGFRKYTTRPDAVARYHEIMDELQSNGRNTKMRLGPNSTNPTNPANSTNPTNWTQPLTAKELMEMTFEPTRWVVPDVLPEGLSLLVGKPKKGKSWMALGMCEAVATGGVAFGTRRVEQGDALYLALEDNHKRLQKRLKKVLNGAPAPDRMHIHTEWQRLDEGGAERLDEWLTDHPEARLVVIDTLAKIRPSVRGSNIYTEDYAALEKLLPLAAKHGVAIIVVHHLRKMGAADPMDEISSSTGLTAGVDGFLILRRTPGSKGPTLFVDGRDIEEPTEYALHWNHNTATWTIEGDAEEVRLSKERGDILLTLNRSPAPLTPKEVSDMMPGAKYNNVKYLMWAMLGDGQLVKDDRGRYSPANPTNPPNPTNSTNSTNPASERVAAVSGLVDAPAPPNPTFPDTYAENGDTVSGVSGVSGDGAHPLHTPDEESW
jgi:hypothetical protein